MVSGAYSGSVTPEDLIAYIDGEASGEVSAMIEADPALRAEASAYAQAQRHLLRNLYRFACPSSQTLGEYELGMVAPAERTRIAAHIVGCPRCTAEMQMLREFLATEEDAPPVGAVGRIRRMVATLLPPPPLISPHAALRGRGDGAARTYQADDVTITLDLGAPVRRGRTSLVGLIWRDNDDPATIAGSTVTLLRDGDIMHTSEIDDVGNFAFDDITPGTYELGVTLGEDHITIEGVAIGQ